VGRSNCPSVELRRDWKRCEDSFSGSAALLLGLGRFFQFLNPLQDRLRSLVIRVLGYRSGGPGSILGTTRKKM
jgi:hypothetical protein